MSKSRRAYSEDVRVFTVPLADLTAGEVRDLARLLDKHGVGDDEEFTVVNDPFDGLTLRLETAIGDVD